MQRTDTPAHIPLGFLLLLGGLAALGPFSVDMYLPAFPQLQRHFTTTTALVQSSLSVYFLGLAVGQLIMGPLADRFGRRPPLLAGLSIYIIASVICTIAPTIEALLAARFLQAVGACAGMVVARAVLRDLYPPRDMARALSLIMLVMGLAPVVAPLAGSVLNDAFGWPSIFIALVIYGALTLGAVYYRLPETLVTPNRDLHPLRVARRYLEVFSDAEFRSYALAGSFAQGGLFVYIASSSFVFVEVYHLSSTQFAMLFGFNAAGLIAASQLNERWLRRSSPESILPKVLTVFSAASTLLVITAYTGFGGVIGITVPLFFTIACLGFCFPNSTAAAMNNVGDRAGVAAALLGTLQFGLAGIASYVAGHLFNGTALPMALIIFFCGMCAWAALLSLRLTPTPPITQTA